MSNNDNSDKFTRLEQVSEEGKEVFKKPYKGNNSFKYKGHAVTLIYIICAVVFSQIVMFLDQSRIFAYGVVPAVFFTFYAEESGLKWSSNKALSFLLTLAITLFWIMIIGLLTINNYIPVGSIFGVRVIS